MEDKSSFDGVGTSIIIGGLAGGVSSAIGSAVSQVTSSMQSGSSAITNQVGQKVTQKAIDSTERIIIGAVGGAAGGLVSGATTKLIENVMTYGKLRNCDIISYLVTKGETMENALEIVRLLEKWSYIKDEKITS